MTASLTLGHLTCEYRVDPLGIEAERPRLGWLPAAARRAERQSAYRILVASSPDLLAQGRGDLWDSGRIASDAVAQVAYAGAPLQPRARAWWQVMAWDGEGQPSPWSATAWWERGLGEPWRARWIGGDPVGDDERLGMVGCQWIRQAGDVPAGGMLEARLRFELPAGELSDAYLEFVCDGYDDPWNRQRAYIVVNGRTHDNWQGRGKMRAPSRWSIQQQLTGGANEVALRAPRSDGCALLAQVVVAFNDGRTLRFPSSESWQARVGTDPGPGAPAADAGWERGEGWAAARPVGAFGAGPFPDGHIFNAMDRPVPPLVFRRDWTAARPVAGARLYATACGIYELWINGGRVGDHQLTPGWTDYRKRVQYQCFDVGALVRQGANALAAVVADGWHHGNIFFGANFYGTQKALLLQLHVRYLDGSEEVIASGPEWLCATGAIRSADLFMGQVEDRRRELAHWRQGEIDRARWRAVRVLTPEVGALVAQSDEPVRATEALAPRSIRERTPGRFLIDFGQNLAGRLRIRIGGEPGRVVSIRHGEMLEKDGALYTGNLRSARAVDQVVCDGTDAWFEPAFTFHGFRYAEVSGLAAALNPEDVRAVVLNSDCPWTGSFSCSDPRLVQLHSNIRWGQRSNFISIPTDCPQRDERAGWTGDAQIFVGTATFNMGCAPFFAKYQRDMVDAQHANGAFPDFAPTNAYCDPGRFGWGDAGVTVPWTVWRVYGDTRIIEENLPHMMRWVEHRTARAKDWLNTDWSFGDWVSPLPQTPNEVLSPIFHFWTALQVAEMAEAIGAGAEAARCRMIQARVQTAWLAKHVDADGRISCDTQAAYALALSTMMAPPGLSERMAPHFIAAIERANWHLHTGFLGTGHLLPALSRIGREDVAFRLLVTDTYPSWLYSLKHGATTMWERWDGYHAELGPQNVGNMNSYNHYAFGAVGEWMYATIGGLQALETGGARWRFRPRPGGVLTHASASFRTVRGTVGCAWAIRDGRFQLSAEVPIGAQAEIHLPTRDPASAREGTRALADGCEGLIATRREADALVLTVASGRYAFSAAV